MNTIQSIAGLLILLFGTFVGIVSGNYFIVMVGVTCGFLLLSLAKLLDQSRDSHLRVLGIPLNRSQIRTIIANSAIFAVESESIDVYPGKDVQYPLIVLDNEKYIRAKVFYKCLSQADDQYTFQLPHETIVLHCSDHYYPGVDLIDLGDQVLVRLSALKLSTKVLKSRLILAAESRGVSHVST